MQLQRGSLAPGKAAAGGTWACSWRSESSRIPGAQPRHCASPAHPLSAGGGGQGSSGEPARPAPRSSLQPPSLPALFGLRSPPTLSPFSLLSASLLLTSLPPPLHPFPAPVAPSSFAPLPLSRWPSLLCFTPVLLHLLHSPPGPSLLPPLSFSPPPFPVPSPASCPSPVSLQL